MTDTTPRPPDMPLEALAEQLNETGEDGYGLEFAIFLEAYEKAFWTAGLARKALQEIDDALYSLKLQRKALAAEVSVKEHAFTDFILAHQDAMPRLHAYQRVRQTRAAADQEPLL